jgi:hypothetical protein
LLPPSSPSPILVPGASNLLNVLGPSCLLPFPSPPPLPFCSVFVPGDNLWCVAFVDLAVLSLSLGSNFGGFHPNSPPSFLILCSSPISYARYATHRLLLDLSHAPCDVLQHPYSDGFPAS